MRDLRDPQRLGEELLKLVKKKRRASQAYDLYSDTLEHPTFPTVSADDSMCKIAQAEYRARLEARDDKYAKSALERIDSV